MERRSVPNSNAFLRHLRFLAPLVLSCTLHAAQQAKPPAPNPPPTHSDSKPEATKPDVSKYAQEPIVIEDLAIKVRYESDGRGTVDYAIRERIQAESAVTSEGVLPFQYDSDPQTLQIKYVRVRKPDGSGGDNTGPPPSSEA